MERKLAFNAQSTITVTAGPNTFYQNTTNVKNVYALKLAHGQGEGKECVMEHLPG